MFLQHGIILHQGERPVIIRRIKPIKIIEPIVCRQIGVCMSLMPLADKSRGVTSLPQNIRKSHLLFGKSSRCIGEQDAFPIAVHARPHRITGRQQTGTGRRRHGSRSIKRVHLHTFGGQTVNMRSPDGRMPVTTQIAVTHIIHIDQNDIGPRIRPFG